MMTPIPHSLSHCRSSFPSLWRAVFPLRAGGDWHACFLLKLPILRDGDRLFLRGRHNIFHTATYAE
jgi:hypothetical protein